MSKRVSDYDLALWARFGGSAMQWMACELIVRRAGGARGKERDVELERWQALGESPEAVRQELDSLRLQSQPYAPHAPVVTEPPPREKPRLTLLDALEKEAEYLGPDDKELLVGDLRELIREVRKRAAGEVL